MDLATERTIRRCRVRVRGVVQGVGFRPFVYRIAEQHELSGFIGNDTDGVLIEVEGPHQRIDSFLQQLRADAPLMARIDAIIVEDKPLVRQSGFQIVTSQVLGHVSTGIPADSATCADCLRELLDPTDRRYRYPFLNCTNCGPRFTITKQIPYDRPQTSMAKFPMCAACQAEYDDPRNRRFHAQPNACRDCGPRLELCGADGKKILSEDPLVESIERILRGEILAIKGIGGFHLCVDATNEAAVTRLRQRKRRYGKPFAVMVADVGVAASICELTVVEKTLLASAARPIVITRAQKQSGIAESVAPGIPWLGVFLPYAPLQHLLFADRRVTALVMTSGNLGEEPIAIDNVEARLRLAGIADAFLMHDREILQRCDDSVIAEVDGAPQLVRRARGFVPLGLELPFYSPSLLAVGGHLKSVFTLAKGQRSYQSQHLGDLESVTGLDFFKQALNHLMHTFEIDPEIVAHDMHPGYLSTTWAAEWAQERGLPLTGVQHHHAHIAACMAEHKLQDPVIGLALDGTGYGTDGRVWGGEVLICSLTHFERFAHLDYVPMPGGDAAVREPWRMALAHLSCIGLDVQSPRMLRVLGAKSEDVRLLMRMIERNVNSPLTSSLGRLFDAAAAISLGRRTVDYEAQAAIEFEGAASDTPDGKGYEMNLVGGNWELREPIRLSAKTLWAELLEDLSAGLDIGQISAKFHSGIASAYVCAAAKARALTGINRVALSGGVMHNRRIVRLLREGLQAQGLEVFQHLQVSPGDGGLSYGQAVIAAAQLSSR